MLLLLIIYIAFIGLGLPNSLFGTAWPAIYADLGLPFSFGSFITLLTSTGTIISSLMSDTISSIEHRHDAHACIVRPDG